MRHLIYWPSEMTTHFKKSQICLYTFNKTSIWLQWIGLIFPVVLQQVPLIRPS